MLTPKDLLRARNLLVSLVLASSWAGCGDGGRDEGPPTGWHEAGDLTLDFVAPPVDGLEGVSFAEAVAYGEHERQVFDAFLPDASAPTPAVLYFHGGGFVMGSRTGAYGGSASDLREVLDGGAAYFAVDYRLLLPLGEETEGVRKSIFDARRALQFIRHHADVFNIDPARVGVYGVSAGAGTSLWLGFADEAAAPRSRDHIARQSSRPNALAAIETQATYDVMRWVPELFAPWYPGLTNELVLSLAPFREMIVQFYGLPGELQHDAVGLDEALSSAEMLEYRAEFDMLALYSGDDPPAYVQNRGEDESPLGDPLHHPLHAFVVHAQAQEVGADLVASVPAFELASPETAMSFLLDRL